MIHLVYQICTHFLEFLGLLDRAHMVVPVLRCLRIPSWWVMEECAVFCMHCYRKDIQGPSNTLFQGTLLQYSPWKQSPCSTKREVNDILTCTGHCVVQTLSTLNMKLESSLHAHNHLFNNHTAQMEHLLRKAALYSPNSKKQKQNKVSK